MKKVGVSMIYGYCRISTREQNIERQERNILKSYPEAKIVKEVFTGRKFQGRKELDKMLKNVKAEDTIVFDSVSRMSRDAEEGYDLYEALYTNGVTMVFLNEPHINTETYKQAAENRIKLSFECGDAATDELMQTIVEALNKYILHLAKEQIRLAFGQAQKEVDDLRERTKGGIETARENGKQIGQKAGAKLNVKKAAPAKEIIRKHNKSFGGALNDTDTMTLAKISRKTFYKYKKEIAEELSEEMK